MIIYGKQVLLEIVEKYPKLIEEIYLSKEVDKKIFNKLVSVGKKVLRLDTQKAQAMARGGNHQGFLAKLQEYKLCDINELKKENFLVVLYGITDVGNIGSIVRSAYALGCDGIIISEINSINLEGVARVSSGALFGSKLAYYKNTKDLLNELKMSGFEIYGADMGENEYKNEDFNGKKRVLIMGNESEGLGNKITQKCDKIISIKMKNNFDSLNVSNAAAILIERMRSL